MNTLLRLLRFILSPIADPNWLIKIDQRRFLACLTPVDFLPMPPEGPLTLGGDLFSSIQFHHDGTVRVDKTFFKRGTNFVVDLNDKVKISRAGPLLLILQHQMPLHALTYEQGGWLQWRYQRPRLSQAIQTEFFLNRELGARIVYTVFILSLISFFTLYVVMFLFAFFGLA